MKASELRIGNWIDHIWKKDGYVDDEIRGWQHKQIVPNDIPACVKYNETYRPIPLTEEWLLKFGFSCTENTSWSTGSAVKYNVLTNGNLTFNSLQNAWWLNGRVLDKQLQFVHHLQNLYFALTGKELELTPSTV